jgi:hypothetical protein
MARIPDLSKIRATLSAVFSASTGFRIALFLVSGLMLQAQVGRFLSLLMVASGLSLLWKAL